jgi:glycosyltransferase involved in cell wall biosynthesis
MTAATRDVVTVVIPTHNRVDVLPHVLQAILGQEQVSVAVVVVDDASTDGTADLLSSYPEVTVVHHDVPTEQRKARNDGARAVQTPWLAFCDDDDLWAPTKLRRQLDALTSAGADWCACSSIFVDERLEPVGGHRVADAREVERLLPRQNMVPGGGSGVLMRTSLFQEVGGFREDARYVEDWDLWLKASRAGTLVCVDELLVAQRQWSRSYSHKNLEEQYRAFLDMTLRYGDGTVAFRGRPLHLGAFEIQQRLCNGQRLSLVKELPRILRRSPEDWRWAVAMLALPEHRLRALRLRMVGEHDVECAREWLAAVQSRQCGVQL